MEDIPVMEVSIFISIFLRKKAGKPGQGQAGLEPQPPCFLPAAPPRVGRRGGRRKQKQGQDGVAGRPGFFIKVKCLRTKIVEEYEL